MKLLTSILLCLCYFFANAQHPTHPDWAPNLVPNPSFETVKKGIKLDQEPYLQFRHYMLHWTSPTETTPDLLGVDPRTRKNIQDNNLEEDIPRTGNRAVAIITDNPQVSETRTDTYREYIQAKLEVPLQEGEEYMVEFYVKKTHNAKLISNNIGVRFTPGPLAEENFDPVLAQPLFNHDELITLKDGWVKIGGKFMAKSSYDYIMIGNFFDTKNTIVKQIKDEGWNNSYYIVDDVNVYQLSNIEPQPEPEPEPEPMPEPEPEPVVETVENVKVEVGKKIALRNIFFETAKWNLLPASNDELNKLVNLMNEYPTMEIAIHGHTDSQGGTSYNQNLSENRAGAVLKYLTEHGIAESRMVHEGFGELSPIATNETKEGRQLNRRVEFLITKIEDGVEVEGN